MKRIASVLCATIVSILLVVPAFALSDEQLNSVFVPVDGLHFEIASNYHEAWVTADYTSDALVFMYRNSAQSFVLTRELGAVVIQDRKNSNGDVVNSKQFVCDRVFYQNPDDSSDIIYTQSGSYVNEGYPGEYTPELLAFNSVVGTFSSDAIVATFKQFEQIYVPPEPSLRASFSVPAGYVAVFKSSSGTALSGSATFGFKSYPINLSVSAFGNTGQGYGYLDSEPSGSLTFPTSNFTYFPWQKSNPRDALGQTYNGHFSLNLNPSSSQVCYIYNPLYNPNAKDGPLNPSIAVNIDGISHLRLYPLHNGVIDTGDGWGSSSDDGYENPYIGTIDPDNGSVSYEDGSGNAVIPEYGGSNIVPDVDASLSLGEAVKSILKEIVSAITGIFSLAYQAIISLVGLAGPFFGELAALYSWLPAPVLTALTSAMILAVTIGVIRAFL